MNYDPIHDTYTDTPAILAATRVPHASATETPQHFPSDPQAPTGRKAAPASDNAAAHPQSSLHHLLDNTENVVTQKDQEECKDQQGGPNNGCTPRPNGETSTGANSTIAENGAAKINGSTHPPPKDAKFSINNLVDSDATQVTANGSVNSIVSASNVEHSRPFDDHETAPAADTSLATPGAAKVPLGSLPPDFRSVSSGFKHLKKADGEPFWRRDIQHDFLAEIFADPTRVFTNPFPPCELPNAANGPKLTFAELYIRTLAESSKSSRVLRERLILDPEMAIAVSKVCLLVNTGRMNTTINFVPDMRSALRTYHLIPSLQADPTGASRQLQDTPRLKTILKAVCDEEDRRVTLLDILRDPAVQKPNTNIIKLIFLMSSFFQNIPYHYYVMGGEAPADDYNAAKPGSGSGVQNRFMEFFLNDKMHPKSRAHRFLWLMYTYMETSFQLAELDANPFHPSMIPPVAYLTPDEMVLFDNDTDFEVEYAEKMYHARMLHLEEDVKVPKFTSKKHMKKLLAVYNREQGLTENDSDDSDDPDGKDDSKGSGADRVKRKRPTASVGSLVDDSKRVSNHQPKWENPEFPLVRLRGVRQRIAPFTRGIEVKPLGKDSALSVEHRKDMARQSKLIVAHMAGSVPDYKTRRRETTQWMYRYFQYKKNSGNGLLGIEWEEIRSDLVNGIEGYVYQQLGKQLVKNKTGEQVGEDAENADAEAIKEESVSTSHLTGDAVPVEISDIEPLGTGYLPIHDFDKASERTTHELLLLQYMESALSRYGRPKRTRHETIHFDLESDSLSFT